MIEFHLEARSGVPTYLQLVQQVRQAIRLGILRSGDQLPTVKEVVSSLTINPNTVLRAYRDLEHEGLLVSRPGIGTFVAEKAPPAIAASSYRSLRAELEAWIRKAHAAGLDHDTLVALVAHVVHASTQEVVA